MSGTARLGGVELNYGGGWELRAGVEPVQRQFAMSTQRALDIFKRGQRQVKGNSLRQGTRTRSEQKQDGPLDFVIDSPGWPSLKVSGLYAVEVHPLDDHLSSVLVADSRWLLKRKHILREFNVRKNTGEFHWVQDAPVQVQRPVEDYVYKRVSTNNGTKWTAREVLEDVLTRLVGKNYRIAGTLPLKVDVEGLVIDDSGDAALSRVLALMPGAGVYLDRNGVYVVYNTLDLSEGKVVEKIESGGRRHWGSTIKKIDKSLIRPVEVGNYFEEEIELRLDYTELADTATTRTKPVPGREPREIENVFPVADPEVEFGGKKYARGSWLQVDDWITATEAARASDAIQVPNAEDFKFSQDTFRRHALTGFRFPKDVLSAWNAGLSVPLNDQRYGVVETHWRRTFRLSPRYMDKLKSIRAVRVAILDQETGTRARADVYADYLVRPSFRGIVKRGNEKTQAAYNLDSYHASLASAKKAPADVQILDPVNGIFRLNFVADPYGEGVFVYPGHLDTASGKIPSWDASTTSGAVAEYVTWESEFVFLSSQYRVAVVLTVARAAPNDVSRYHLETVTPQVAASVLPGGKIGKCLGAPWVMKIGAAVETARYMWRDASSAIIDGAVWNGDPMPDSLLVNPEHLKNVAKANAARVYAMLLDRHEGSLSVSLDPSIEPTGSLSSVVHTIDQNGVVATQLIMPPIQVPVDIWALMPDSTRKVLQRQVQP